MEHVLLAVAAGAGFALLPETVTERFAAPGIRFVALEASEAAFRTAVLTHPDADSVATRALLSALARTGRPRCPQPSSGGRAGRMTWWAS